MATRHAQAQMQPGVADLQAVFTAVRAGRYLFYLIEVGTAVGHINLLLAADNR